jgi:nucleotide-binding universal stress UspA family protein
MFHTIIVATDGSDHADKAVAVAGDLAAKYDATMILLHVLLRRNAAAADLRKLIDIHELPDAAREEFERFESMQATTVTATAGVVTTSLPFPTDVLLAVGQAITDKAEGIALEHGAKKFDRIVGEGDPADVILDTANYRHADLIVLGTRGLSDLKGLFVGSVSHKVSHLADCTCITVR